jgi:DNA-binding protein HU-beta
MRAPADPSTRRGYDALVRRLAQAHGLSIAGTRRVLDDLWDELADAAKRPNPPRVPGFGIFRVRQRVARRIRNPQTGELMELPRQTTLTFRAAPDRKEWWLPTREGGTP